LWQDVLHHHAGLAGRTSNLDRQHEIEELAGQLTLPNIRQVIINLEQALERLEHNVNTRLTAEVLFLNLPFFRT
jgi:hypothetical protein